jgi:hypothetical protein
MDNPALGARRACMRLCTVYSRRRRQCCRPRAQPLPGGCGTARKRARPRPLWEVLRAQNGPHAPAPWRLAGSLLFSTTCVGALRGILGSFVTPRPRPTARAVSEAGPHEPICRHSPRALPDRYHRQIRLRAAIPGNPVNRHFGPSPTPWSESNTFAGIGMLLKKACFDRGFAGELPILGAANPGR